MDSPLDNIVDLGLVNYVRHPNNPDYIVFRFADQERADDFEKTLKEREIWFERAKEERKQRTYHLFGIRNRDFNTVSQINYAVEGRNRRFLIDNKIIRWSLVVFGIVVLGFAIFGYCSRTPLDGNEQYMQQVSE